ncbi:uncharacterized protein M6B38_400030 [Iris pallida]|uniref:J domain-containing protein n=1 Tax=Iris pallida TaxID=29817 RepID=A0AAX6FU50_IRIPA|nr:uncharacterized protein M6B38_400030 [Iris pallida]
MQSSSSSSLWRKVAILKNPLISSSSSQFAPFHSTPISLSKRSAKWNFKDQGRGQKPSKAQIRFVVRQKRADTKKALKDFLFYGKPSKYFQDDNLNWSADEAARRNTKSKSSLHDSDNFSRSTRSGNSKPHTSSDSRKGNSWGKRWKQRLYDADDDRLKSKFEATFGGQRCYTWSFTWEEKFDFNYSSTAGFDWRAESKSEKAQKRVWSESDVEDESPDIGFHSQRVTLGLPPTGPLNLNDVKCAFRASALRWHPDKHQGPSQAMAEEKFKICVNAYNSLCNVLKPT